MDCIEYNDSVFGPHRIAEPVIVELIHGPSLQRLQGVDQSGYPDPFFPHVKKQTRFEHSLGVYLLLRQYHASLEEQIAGLIHDVSHSAFSHCIDYALTDIESEKTQSHQDNVFEAFVRKSEIPEILARHGLSVDAIIDDSLFPLKEQPLPDLCADRIDYSLRSALALREDFSTEIQHILSGLLTDGKQWYFSDSISAKKYAELFSQLNATFWSGLPSAIMLRTVGDCLRYACEKKYLEHTDFYTTDRAVLEKLKRCVLYDSHLHRLFDRMNNSVPIHHNPNDYESVVFCKSRAIDPLCLHEGSLKRLSDVEPAWRHTLKKESAPKSYFLKFG